MQPPHSLQHPPRTEYLVPHDPIYAPRCAEAMCCVMIASVGTRSARAVARQLRAQLSAPPFNLPHGQIPSDAPGTIRFPWRYRTQLLAAVASLRPGSQALAAREGRSPEAEIDRNTLASMVGLGAGLLRHVIGPRVRRWRFASVAVEERIGLCSVTWTAHDASATENYVTTPELTIKGGPNLAKERSRMAARLAIACGLQLR